MNARPRDRPAAPCPLTALVGDYYAGTLDKRRSAELEDHLTGCDLCSSAVDTLTDSSDATLRALSTLAGVADDEPEFLRLESELLGSAGPGSRRSPRGRRLADPAVGDLPCLLGNYKLQRRIGRGAWGAVFQAQHTQLDLPVAVKVLDSSRLPDEQAIGQFLSEAKAAGQLRHPHIVRATDAGQQRGFHYLAMDLVDGLDAGRLLQAAGEVRVPDACEIIRQAAVALEFAHRRGWVHRDVKPSNLMVSRTGEVKLLDLGIAGQWQAPRTGAEGEPPLGTAAYMAPEQWADFHRVDGRADVYSLGCTLWKLLTGRTPNESSGLSLRERRPEAGRALDRLAQRMLAPNADQRIGSAGEVATALKRPARGADLPGLVARLDNDRPDELSTPCIDAPRQPLLRSVTRRRALAGVGVFGAAAALLPWLTSSASPQLRRLSWRPLHPVGAGCWLSLGPPEQTTIDEPSPGRLRVGSEELSLVAFGRAIAAPFAMRVALRQQRNSGASGLFFRGMLDPDNGSQRFHLLELRPPDEQDPSAARRLLWSEWRIAPNADQPLRLPLAETPVELAGDPRPQQLQITVGTAGFPEVTWNGRPLAREQWNISTAGQQLAGTPLPQLAAHSLGYVGVANSGDATEFIQPEMAYL